MPNKQKNKTITDLFKKLNPEYRNTESYILKKRFSIKINRNNINMQKISLLCMVSKNSKFAPFSITLAIITASKKIIASIDAINNFFMFFGNLSKFVSKFPNLVANIFSPKHYTQC